MIYFEYNGDSSINYTEDENEAKSLGYTKTNDIFRLIHIEGKTYFECDAPYIPENYFGKDNSPYEISKLYLKLALLKIGLWDQFVQWLKTLTIQIDENISISAWDAYQEALVLNTGSELFEPYLNIAKEQFKDYLTSEQIDQLLESCKAK